MESRQAFAAQNPEASSAGPSKSTDGFWGDHSSGAYANDLGSIGRAPLLEQPAKKLLDPLPTSTEGPPAGSTRWQTRTRMLSPLFYKGFENNL